MLKLSKRNFVSTPARLMVSVCLLICISSAAVTSRASGEGRGSDTAIAFQTAGGQARQAEIRELKQGQVIERELAGGEAHTYRIALVSGQYMKAVVEQRGVDVVLRLFGPDGKKRSEVDNDPAIGFESVSAIAEAPGDYRLEVRSQNKDVAAGRYEIKVEELRDATSKDQVHVSARRLTEEGNQLRDQRTAESRRKAIEKYEGALPLWREAGDKKGEALTINDIGFIYAMLAEPRKALEYYRQALMLWRVVEDRLNEAITLSNIGSAYTRLGDLQRALDYYNQALNVKRDMGDRFNEAVTLQSIGGVYMVLGQQQEALKYLNQALPLIQAAGDRRMEAVTLNHIANSYSRLGEMQSALEYHNQALTRARDIGDRGIEGSVLSDISAVYQSLGDVQKDLEYKNKALPLLRIVGDRRRESFVLGGFGSIYLDLGEPQKALDYFNQSLSLWRAVGDRLGEAATLSNIGASYNKLGEPQKALNYSDQALSLSRALGNRTGEANTLTNIGTSYTLLNEPHKALENYRQALQLSRSVGERNGEARALYNIARVQRALGNIGEARTQIEAALNIIEPMRAKLASQELRRSLSASKQDYYKFYVDLLMRMHQQQPLAGHDAAALQATERSRARSLLEILIEGRVDIRQGADPVLLERERALQHQLSVKAEWLTRLLGGQHTEGQETAARKEVDALLTDHQEMEAQIRTKSPRYAALTQPQPLSLKEIQQQVLDEDTLLLEYALGEEGSYLWAVTPTSITVYELPKGADVEAPARRVYEALSARNKTVRFEKQEKRQVRIAEADAEYLRAAKVLSQMVLGPVMKQLERKRLLIVTEGALMYVPFGALPIPRRQRATKNKRQPKNESYRPLIAEHEIISLPSASVLAELRKESTGRHTDKTVAVFADPVFQDDDPRVSPGEVKAKRSDDQSSPSTRERGLDSDLERSAREVGDLTFARLPHTRQEAEEILALTPKGKGLKSLDFEASRAVAKSSDLSQYRILHFATHALLNSEHPELSGVVLSLVDREGRPQDGFLRLYEIYNLRLGADLVVLSACRTALGKEIKGEGLVGLTRGFMYAGAPRVIASLWGVEDRSTAELMKSFYSEMLLKGQRPAAALRTAQLRMWREQQLPPYFWAAFVLQGEWK